MYLTLELTIECAKPYPVSDNDQRVFSFASHISVVKGAPQAARTTEFTRAGPVRPFSVLLTLGPSVGWNDWLALTYQRRT